MKIQPSTCWNEKPASFNRVASGFFYSDDIIEYYTNKVFVKYVSYEKFEG